MRKPSLILTLLMTLGFACALASPQASVQAQTSDLAQRIRALDPKILTAEEEEAKAAARMLYQDMRTRRYNANQRETKAWKKLKTVSEWEKFRDVRIAALKKSLGAFPAPPKEIKVHITKTTKGDGFQIRNVVFASRPGFLVTANLYMPAQPVQSMPGIMICHSHHNPKTQGELQDMGMLWARLGCAVLVMDQVGHGERRQHPFPSAKSFPKQFRVSRQDYYFRYNTGLQLHLVGESLIGWMAWDLMRGVDVLLSQRNIDPKRIILMGAVAGGGDPAAVTAALDKRITAVAPFNFGGPEPENIFPLPPDAEDSFNYAGGGSWETTRNLRLSIKHGFAPWVIVGAAAPRGLIYAHEFAWDKQRDPVWKRLQKIYAWYKVPDRLASVAGRGSVKGRPPESTHCNNIGAVHRKQIYPALKDWFDIPVPKSEFSDRRSTEELLCLTPALKKENQLVCELATNLAHRQIQSARKKLTGSSLKRRRAALRKKWSQLLGSIPDKMQAKKVMGKRTTKIDSITVQKLVLNTERDILVPVLLLTPPKRKARPHSVVVAIAQDGHAGFLKQRSETIAHLLTEGVAVCLPDLRGTGETQAGKYRGRQSSASSLSASEQMLGETIPGGQLRDLLALLHYLRSQTQFDSDRIALWGDTFASFNDDKTRIAVPLGTSFLPSQAEPMGASIALLGGLFDERVCAVAARGGIGSFTAVLESPFLYLPHDAIVPGATTAGDVADASAALAPRPLRLEAMVDGLNRPFSAKRLQQSFAPARQAYESVNAAANLRLLQLSEEDAELPIWLAQQVRK